MTRVIEHREWSGGSSCRRDLPQTRRVAPDNDQAILVPRPADWWSWLIADVLSSARGYVQLLQLGAVLGIHYVTAVGRPEERWRIRSRERARKLASIERIQILHPDAGTVVRIHSGK